MRPTYQDYGWLVSETGQIYGFALGFDFCAEHEYGAPAIKEALGIARDGIPIGIEDRTMTRVPEELAFVEYVHKSRDGRVKRTMPAALLVLKKYRTQQEMSGNIAETIGACDVAFQVDFTEKVYYKPEKHDIKVAWSAHSGFAIHVRGEDNVRKLKELHDAFHAQDISLADPQIDGFKRNPLCFVINSRFPEAIKAEVRQRDLDYLELQNAAAKTGVKEMLANAGKRYYALEADWLDKSKQEVVFFLNPFEQQKYDSGWYSVEELEAWAREEGPIADGIEAEKQACDGVRDWGICLNYGFAEEGRKYRFLPKFVWLDKANRVPGVRIRFVDGTGRALPSTTLSMDEVQPVINRGMRVREQKKAESEAKQMTA